MDRPQPKRTDFAFCPQCEGSDLSQTDYEKEDGTEDTDGRHCDDCGWEGDVAELVSLD